MFFYNTLDDRKAEPRAPRLAGHIRLKGLPEDILAESWAIVAHDQLNLLPAPARAGTLEQTGRHVHPASSGGAQRLDAIADQIGQDLAQSPPIRLNIRHLSAQVQRDLDGRVAQQVELGDFAHEHIEAEAADLHVRGTRVVAEGVDHLLHRIDLLHDRVGRALEQLGVLRT